MIEINRTQNFEKRVVSAFKRRYDALAVKTDRLFCGLFGFQWLLGIAFAFFVSPRTWSGDYSQIHLHLYAAIVLGGLIASAPVFMVVKSPGATQNRIVIAVSQMLYSVLLIHLSGGRIETHFHIFGSLAFLAFYRDWRPLVIATLVAAVDHLLRGFYWPESVYGVLSAGPLRAIEHFAWMLFEDLILLYSIVLARRELWSISESQVTLEDKSQALQRAHDETAELNRSLEARVLDRTRQLEESQNTILAQQQSLVSASKMSALGEMAGGIAHEINTPLAIISMWAEQMSECVTEDDRHAVNFAEGLDVIKRTVDRIAKIVSGLRFFARDGLDALPQRTKISSIVEDTLGLCREKFTNHGVKISVLEDKDYYSAAVDCRSVEISQVLLNLLNNAFDAVVECSDRWASIAVSDLGEFIEITVTDSGKGIAKDLEDKIMQPFFTTKQVGKGTGLGLSVSKGIVERHSGQLVLNREFPNTRFSILLPKSQQR